MIEVGENGDGNKQRWEAMAVEGYASYPEYSSIIADEIIAEIDAILCAYYTTNSMLFIEGNEAQVKVSIYNIIVE